MDPEIENILNTDLDLDEMPDLINLPGFTNPVEMADGLRASSRHDEEDEDEEEGEPLLQTSGRGKVRVKQREAQRRYRHKRREKYGKMETQIRDLKSQLSYFQSLASHNLPIMAAPTAAARAVATTRQRSTMGARMQTRSSGRVPFPQLASEHALPSLAPPAGMMSMMPTFPTTGQLFSIPQPSPLTPTMARAEMESLATKTFQHVPLPPLPPPPTLATAPPPISTLPSSRPPPPPPPPPSSSSSPLPIKMSKLPRAPPAVPRVLWRDMILNHPSFRPPSDIAHEIRFTDLLTARANDLKQLLDTTGIEGLGQVLAGNGALRTVTSVGKQAADEASSLAQAPPYSLARALSLRHDFSDVSFLDEDKKVSVRYFFSMMHNDEQKQKYRELGARYGPRMARLGERRLAINAELRRLLGLDGGGVGGIGGGGRKSSVTPQPSDTNQPGVSTLGATMTALAAATGSKAGQQGSPSFRAQQQSVVSDSDEPNSGTVAKQGSLHRDDDSEMTDDSNGAEDLRRAIEMLSLVQPPPPQPLSIAGHAALVKNVAQRMALERSPSSHAPPLSPTAASAPSEAVALRAALLALKEHLIEEQLVYSEVEYILFNKILAKNQAAYLFSVTYPAIQDMRAILVSIMAGLEGEEEEEKK